MRKKIILTYGTFDLFHTGHQLLLERAKALGDYLIVGVTTENYDESRGKLNVQQNLMQRIANIQASGLADKIIIEEYEGQKINDIQKYQIDTFAIGSDWQGKFDYLNDYCNVVYLQRTQGVSSTELRNSQHGLINLGIVGYGRIAQRFIKETYFVSGVNLKCAFGRNTEGLKKFIENNKLSFYDTDYTRFLEQVDAVYIATPHLTHYSYAKQALEAGKHVLCEKPATLVEAELKELFDLAKAKQLIFIEAIKTAYAPGFIRMIALAKSGLIGRIINVDASFTKLYNTHNTNNIREFSKVAGGGSFTELATYPLLAITKLLGTQVIDTQSYAYYSASEGVDLFTKMHLHYPHAMATLKVGLGVKTEGDLTIAGTEGYLYVPAPWWLTEYFEIRFEDQNRNKKYYYKFDGDGLRYELADFIAMINNKQYNYKVLPEESLHFAKIIEGFIAGKKVIKLDY